LTEHPTINAIAKKLDATPAQVLVAWSASRGYSVIPKSVHADRIESNFKQVELPEEDIKEIDGLEAKEGRERFNYPYRYKPWWDISIFDEEVDKNANIKVKVL
jgi:L-glyceraldehyde reductase